MNSCEVTKNGHGPGMLDIRIHKKEPANKGLLKFGMGTNIVQEYLLHTNNKKVSGAVRFNLLWTE